MNTNTDKANPIQALIISSYGQDTMRLETILNAEIELEALNKVAECAKIMASCHGKSVAKDCLVSALHNLHSIRNK